MTQTLRFIGTLKGHSGWVTRLATCYEQREHVASCSRDKKIFVWHVFPNGDPTGTGTIGGVTYRLEGHTDCVHDVVLSSDGEWALSASWDKTLRLWDVADSECLAVFKGHTREVFGASFSIDNQQMISCSRDKTIKLWNRLGECKNTLVEDMHTDWVSCVSFTPSWKAPLIVSAGWDKVVKIWDHIQCKLRSNLVGHTGVIYCIAISPDGSLCASGGKDATAMLWDINEGKHLYSLDAFYAINALAFCPSRYWLAAGTDSEILVWDLENKNVLDELACKDELQPKNGIPWIVSLTWSPAGDCLYAGSSDGNIYVYEIDVEPLPGQSPPPPRLDTKRKKKPKPRARSH